MKITPEISAVVETMDIFGNLRHVIFFLIYSGVNKVSVVGAGGLQGRVCLSTFSHMYIFAYFPPSHDIFRR